MAGVAPFFITGANAKIRLNDRTIAFAQDFSYSVTVKHAAPKVLGKYESDSLEPLSYEVSGSFSIIRYARGAAEALRESGSEAPHGVADSGNGIGEWSSSGKVFFDSDGRANDNLDPAALKLATFFNVEVWQKLKDGRQCGVARIRDCRIERADFTIAGKVAPAMQKFTFRAIFADEDSFAAGFSGTGSLV